MVLSGETGCHRPRRCLRRRPPKPPPLQASVQVSSCAGPPLAAPVQALAAGSCTMVREGEGVRANIFPDAAPRGCQDRQQRGQRARTGFPWKGGWSGCGMAERRRPSKEGPASVAVPAGRTMKKMKWLNRIAPSPSGQSAMRCGLYFWQWNECVFIFLFVLHLSPMRLVLRLQSNRLSNSN